MPKNKPCLLSDVRVRHREQEVKARKVVTRSSLGSSIVLFFVAMLMVFTVYMVIEVFYNEAVVYAAQEKEHKTVSAVITAYTSSVDETDENPHETAYGTTTRKGIIACPAKYKFGTRVIIEGKQYVCEDRMNRRYRDKECFDIWLETKREAFQWGRRELEVKILS